MFTTRTAFLIRLKDHDPESWEQFVSKYHPLIVSIIRRNRVQENDVGDIVQEVFVRLYQVLPRFDYQRSKGTFRGWLNRVTLNTITDWRRKHARRARPVGDLPDVAQHTRPTSESVLRFRSDLFDEAISILKDRTRRKTWACFEEHALKGRGANDVAVELSVSVNVVYVNTSRVMSQIRDYCLQKNAT